MMKTRKRWLLFMLLTLTLAALACSLTGEEEEPATIEPLPPAPDAQPPVDDPAASLTKEPVGEEDGPPPPDQQPQPTPPPDLDEPPIPFSFEGISFAYADVLALNVAGAKVPAVSDFDGFSEGGGAVYEGLPDFTEIVMATGDRPGRVAVQPIRDENGNFYPGYFQNDIDFFTTLEADIYNRGGAPDMAEKAKLDYLDFGNGKGRRSLYLEPVLDPNGGFSNQQFYYSFSGVTADGRYLVWFSYPLRTPVLPATSADGDPSVSRQAYYDEITPLPSDWFTPDLVRLDRLVLTLFVDPVESFNHTVPPEEQALPGGPGLAIVQFDATVELPPEAVIYAVNVDLDMFVAVEIPEANSGTPFTLELAPGNYVIYARSLRFEDISYFGYWAADGSGLQPVQVALGLTATGIILTRPADPCLEALTLPASPDGRFNPTSDYAQQFGCS